MPRVRAAWVHPPAANGRKRNPGEGKGREQEACLERLQGSRAGHAEQDLKRQMGRQTREAREYKKTWRGRGTRLTDHARTD